MFLLKSESPPASGVVDISDVLAWLALSPGENLSAELEALRLHLGALRASPPPPAQLHKLLDRLYARALPAANSLIRRLHHVRLPISPQTRRSARTLQDVLELIARLSLDTADDLGEKLIKGLRRRQDLPVWRAMHALSRHLYLSNLISAPATPGIWQQLHQAMAAGRRLKVDKQVPDGVDCNIMTIYLRTLLLGCAPPSAFTAHEWSSIESYIEKHTPLVDFVDRPLPDDRQSAFWLNPAEDSGPVAASRRPPAALPTLIHFSCKTLLAVLDEHRRLLGQDTRPEALGFPADLPTRLARVLLHRLKAVWGDPRKRSFPRRRQAYRARLCFGFEEVWEMLRHHPADIAATSEWMVTNESPDGYATMHVSGRPHKVQNGDLVALRSEDTSDWQICIVRWALSENPEHLELGLQVLSPLALPATVALPNQPQTTRQRALLMPAVPPLRPHQSIATASGMLMENSGKVILLLDVGKLEVREVHVAAVEEQSPDIDVFAINPERSP